jgi:hypothetical protein
VTDELLRGYVKGGIQFMITNTLDIFASSSHFVPNCRNNNDGDKKKLVLKTLQAGEREGCFKRDSNLSTPFLPLRPYDLIFGMPSGGLNAAM